MRERERPQEEALPKKWDERVKEVRERRLAATANADRLLTEEELRAKDAARRHRIHERER